MWLGAETFAWLLVLTLSFIIFYPSLKRPFWVAPYLVVLTIFFCFYTWLLLFIAPNWNVTFLDQDHAIWLSYALSAVVSTPLFCCFKTITSRIFISTTLLCLIVLVSAWFPPWGWWFIPLVVAIIGFGVYRYIHRPAAEADAVTAAGQLQDPPSYWNFSARAILWLKLTHEIIYLVVLTYLWTAGIWWLNSNGESPVTGESWAAMWYGVWITCLAARVLELGLLYYYGKWQEAQGAVRHQVATELSDLDL